MSERHPSSLRFDALALGAVDASERATLEQHLAGCQRCRSLQAQSVVDRERFNRFVFPRGLDAVRGAPSPWGRLMWLFAPVVVALAVIVGLKWRAPSSPRVVEPIAPVAPATQPVSREAEVRLEVHELTPGTNHELADGAAVKAGSRLRFRLWSSAPQEFCLLLVDGSHQVSLVGRSDHSGRIVNGRTDLEGSYLVERRTAPARVFALFSSEILSCDQIRASVDRLHLDAATLRTTTELSLPPALDGNSPRVAQRSLMIESAP